MKVVADWRENPQRVRELDWHAQLEAMADIDEMSEKSGSDEG